MTFRELFTQLPDLEVLDALAYLGVGMVAGLLMVGLAFWLINR